MSDFASVASVPDYEGTDSQYIDQIVAGVKPARKKPAATSSPLPLAEIAKSLETRIYSSERGSPAFFRELNSDIGYCSFCRYETPDRDLLRQHYSEHVEISSFKEMCARQARRYDGLVERQRQVVEHLQRLKTEEKQINRELAEFDKKSLDRMQSELGQLIRLLH